MSRYCLVSTLFFFAALGARAGEALEVGLTHDALLLDAIEVNAPQPGAYRVLLVSSLDGDETTRLHVISQTRQYDGQAERKRAYHLDAITGLRLSQEMAKFPPSGPAYRTNPEAQALWRWIGIHAPDLVLVVGEDFGLANALANNTVAGVGKIPARKITAKDNWQRLAAGIAEHSEASRERQARLKRTPSELADALGKIYGQSFRQPVYLEGMALLAQSRLGNVADVARLAEAYLNGSQESLGPRASSLNLAGHLVFADIAERTHDPRALALVQRAAALGFEGGDAKAGAMLAAMPFHNEMSDSVFMGTAILTRAGKLTGEPRYFQMAARHLAFMNKLVLRPDGLYRHSPLTDAAWGRGNAFAALGYALALSDWPEQDPARTRVIGEYHALMAALARHQTTEGLWREVIDFPGSYGETSATAMIAFAMEHGIRRGWLEKGFYQQRVDQAWAAVQARTSSDGVFIDVCESTNKQPKLADYLNREALFGKDDRAGGMVLMLATEMAGLD